MSATEQNLKEMEKLKDRLDTIIDQSNLENPLVFAVLFETMYRINDRFDLNEFKILLMAACDRCYLEYGDKHNASA